MADNIDVSPEMPIVQRKDRRPRGKGGHKGGGEYKGDKGGKKGQPSGSTKLRGLDKDSPEVRVSKTLSWLLRHGAASQGLGIRADGYVKVDELFKHPKLRASRLEFDGLRRIVAADEKKRYDLKFEPEAPTAEVSSGADPDAHVQPNLNGSWWIKANQGHSMKTVQLDMKPITSLEDIPSGIALHGTTVAAWKTIEKEGLSKMKRNHIHLAQGVSTTNAISGLRKSAQILIYIDIPKAVSAGIKFSLSDNGVVLTEGDETGYLKPEFFLRVENIKRQALSGWEGPGPLEANIVGARAPAEEEKDSTEEFPVSEEEVLPVVTAMEDLTVAERVESQ